MEHKCNCTHIFSRVYNHLLENLVGSLTVFASLLQIYDTLWGQCSQPELELSPFATPPRRGHYSEGNDILIFHACDAQDVQLAQRPLSGHKPAQDAPPTCFQQYGCRSMVGSALPDPVGARAIPTAVR